jgi:hypothetical protein
MHNMALPLIAAGAPFVASNPLAGRANKLRVALGGIKMFLVGLWAEGLLAL